MVEGVDIRVLGPVFLVVFERKMGLVLLLLDLLLKSFLKLLLKESFLSIASQLLLHLLLRQHFFL